MEMEGKERARGERKGEEKEVKGKRMGGKEKGTKPREEEEKGKGKRGREEKGMNFVQLCGFVYRCRSPAVQYQRSITDRHRSTLSA